MKNLLFCLPSFVLLTLILLPKPAFSQDGMLDVSFSGDGEQVLSMPHQNIYGWQVLELDDHRILVGGNSMELGIYNFILAAYLPDGTQDSLFADNGILSIPAGMNGHSLLMDMLQLGDGKILISARVDNIEKLIRLNTNGSFDSTFGTNGMVTVTPGSGHLAIQNNKILMSGFYFDGTVRYYQFSRYNFDGTYDTQFGTNGIALLNPSAYNFNLIYGIKIQDDGKILVAGTSYDNTMDRKPVLVRLKMDGSMDSTFGNNGLIVESLGVEEMGIFTSLDIRSDGKIIAAGHMEYSGGTGGFWGNKPALVQYHPNGTLDSTFAQNGKLILNTFFGANDDLRTMLVQPDQKIIIGGSSGMAFPNIQSYYYLSRLNPDGTYDMTFGSNGSVLTAFHQSETNANVEMILQRDDKILTSALSQDTSDNLFNAVLCRFTNDIPQNTQPEISEMDGIKIYPNPFSIATTLLFQKEQKNTKITIFDAMGKIVKEFHFSGKEFQFDKGMLGGGIYFVQTIDENNTIFTRKIVVQ